MVHYVHSQEPRPNCWEQLIACYHTMFTMNRTKEFFHKGILTKIGSFKKRAILPKFRVVSSDIKAFLDVYQKFQFHKFEQMDNTPGDFSSNLTKEFYTSYVATLMNLAATTETTK